MEISFLIPTRNRPENLKKNLLYLSKLNIQKLHSEIIVLDDCSELSYASVLLEFENIQYFNNTLLNLVRNSFITFAIGMSTIVIK